MRGITADWLVTGKAGQEPLRKGAVVLAPDDRTVVAIGDGPSLRNAYSNAVWEEGRGVLMPGLVDAFAPLEEIGLVGVGGRGHFELALAMARASIERGEHIDDELVAERCRTMHARGTVAAGVWSTNLLVADALRQARFHCEVFHATRGLREDVVAVMRENSREQRRERGEGLSLIESVHSLYAVHPDAVRAIAADARARGVRMCVPVSESAVARASLEHASGPFEELLAQPGASPRDWALPMCSPLSYAEQLGVLSSRALLASLLDAKASELDALQGKDVVVVLVPRENLFTDARLPDVDAMLRAGLCVALGTGNPAASSDGDLLGEAAALHARYPHQPAQRFLEMTMHAGARALSLEDKLGCIEAGRAPGILLVTSDSHVDSDPARFVLRERLRKRVLLAAQST